MELVPVRTDWTDRQRTKCAFSPREGSTFITLQPREFGVPFFARGISRKDGRTDFPDPENFQLGFCSLPRQLRDCLFAASASDHHRQRFDILAELRNGLNGNRQTVIEGISSRTGPARLSLGTAA